MLLETQISSHNRTSQQLSNAPGPSNIFILFYSADGCLGFKALRPPGLCCQLASLRRSMSLNKRYSGAPFSVYSTNDVKFCLWYLRNILFDR
jgi:hypothetical protein